jgi:hypothetical protein
MNAADLPRSLVDALASRAPSRASRRAMAGRLRALSAARLAVTIFLGSSGGAAVSPVTPVIEPRAPMTRAKKVA